MTELRYREALGAALREEMTRDERVLLMGEDIGVFGGAFKVTDGLLDEFGEKRVRDTPISENTIVGIGVGAAMAGLRPVVELMTINFALLAFDQIVNHAAHIHYMFGGQARVPLVVRMPQGAGHQLGPTHSHCFEALFLHVLAAQDQRLIGLRVDMGPKGFGPGADVDRVILDTARRVFETYGVRRANIEDVAARAGVSRSTIYRRFPTKDDLFEKVVRREAEIFFSTLDQATTGRTPREAHMHPKRSPVRPSAYELQDNGRRFPPNHLHESWLDYLYWDIELEA